MILAQEIFGSDLVVLMVMALGASLAVGTGLALVRPNQNPDDGELERPPLARSLVMIAIGVIAAVWAFVSFLAG